MVGWDVVGCGGVWCGVVGWDVVWCGVVWWVMSVWAVGLGLTCCPWIPRRALADFNARVTINRPFPAAQASLPQVARRRAPLARPGKLVRRAIHRSPRFALWGLLRGPGRRGARYVWETPFASLGCRRVVFLQGPESLGLADTAAYGAMQTCPVGFACATPVGPTAQPCPVTHLPYCSSTHPPSTLSQVHSWGSQHRSRPCWYWS